MAHIIFLNRFFYPDHSATSQILADLAFELATDGHDVHVIAGRNLYGQAGAALAKLEIVRSVVIHRIGSTSLSFPGLAARLLNYLVFYWSAAFALRRMTRRDTIVVAKTDPPLLSVLVAFVLRGHNVHRVNWLQDIYPEVAQKLGIRWLGGPIGSALTRLRDRSLQSASANVVLGSRMRDYLVSRKINPETIRIIDNWVDDEAIHPVEAASNELRRAWGLANKFVVGYSGNLGRAHEFETLLKSAEHFRGRQDICFLFIGGGFQHSALADELRRRNLESLVLFKPYQQQNELSSSLGVPDVHWVSLRPELEGLIVPSKFYGIAAAGRPVLAITGSNGEIARRVMEFACGAVIAPGDSAGLTGLIETMMGNPALCAEWGRNARAMLDAQFSRRLALARWRELFASLLPPAA